MNEFIFFYYFFLFINSFNIKEFFLSSIPLFYLQIVIISEKNKTKQTLLIAFGSAPASRSILRMPSGSSPPAIP